MSDWCHLFTCIRNISLSPSFLFAENARIHLCRIAFSIVVKGGEKGELPPSQVSPPILAMNPFFPNLRQAICLMTAFESIDSDRKEHQSQRKCLPPVCVGLVGFSLYIQEGGEP